MGIETKAEIASFGGKLLKLSHKAISTRCEMAFNLYLPPQAFTRQEKKIPLLIYLSGLTCTAENCSEKGFFQHGASKEGIAVLYPDTSPSEDDSWDFGTGAGFYIDATREPYSQGYNMYTYVNDELPNLVFNEFSQIDSQRVSITGHSMGGHGALTLFLRNPGKYRSVSAFAPICNPMNCPWGQKAFSGYFGDSDRDLWKEHDATELVKRWKGPLKMLIDVGTSDKFYNEGQLLPENFEEATQAAGLNGLCVRFQPGYDHSYYTMASFADEHIAHAAQYLK